jgi:hypothetical protein
VNYEQAKAQLATARNINAGKPIERNTRLFQRGDAIAVQYHQTDIVTFKKNGDTVLNTNGWKTQSTKERLNSLTPVGRIHQEKGVWYFVYQGERHVFKDGLTIKASGKVVGAADHNAVSHETALRRKASLYAKKFTEALYAGKVPPPGPGDCWACLMKTEDGKQPLGGKSHIVEHMEENYFVPSLLINAMNQFGASMAMRSTVHGLVHKEPQHVWPQDFIKKDIAKSIRRHCLSQMGMAA